MKKKKKLTDVAKVYRYVAKSLKTIRYIVLLKIALVQANNFLLKV